MSKILSACLAVLVVCTWARGASAIEFAIIKNAMFCGQKIEVYKSLDEALENYTGEGKIFEITLKPVPMKRVENKKKIEVSEFTWKVDEQYLKDLRSRQGKNTKGSKSAAQEKKTP
ncbi:MAG TPA: hypothetical protein PLS81_05765 [Deltaproteobacteria bacterium]|nr:hypothetical protein [Deltaproteobacteria bacterium]HOM28945.1 hypothetical protein [Deltaproteobacteria bacterium]HPP81373.1 hypothetical protein [Deltaproteobacteria bacterium]